MTSHFMIAIVVGGLIVAGSGCGESLSDQVKKDPNSIIGKKTDDIRQFDPNATHQEVSDSKVRVDDPILGPLQAYGPMVEQISKMQIDSAVAMYEADKGHYPKDYKEFMDGVIKPNHIQLPVLPAGAKYAYDVPNHKLQVIRVTAPVFNANVQPGEGQQPPANQPPADAAPAGSAPASDGKPAEK